MSRRTKRTVETPEYARMLRRLIRSYARRVGEADDVDLAEMVDIKRELDEAVAEAVRRQRELYGRSWADIARGLGCTRQAAQERYGRRAAGLGPV